MFKIHSHFPLISLRFLVAAILIIAQTYVVGAQTIRIMPLGNSITYDENSADGSNPRPDGQRISYRYRLYQLLDEAGYDFDYVGTKNCGYDYFQDTELDDNAGFPGIETWQLSNLIKTGFNPITGYYESPGPYLIYNPADIILLHIGTNALITSAYQVEDLLDNIRMYDSDVTILVARIINRRTYSASTTSFNNNVEMMVNLRGDPNIHMVDMENGADINYSTDMSDNLHPNQSGFTKMGEKWYDALMSLNQAPVVSQIPDQYTGKAQAFDPINLDEYVTDSEDPSSAITWTFERKLGSMLNVVVDANRNLLVSPIGEWYGIETLTLKATDTGNGVFPQTTESQVTFHVSKGNDPPVISSSPVTEIDQEDTYNYTIQAIDFDGDSLTYSVIAKPSFLDFNVTSHNLNGIPHNDNVGTHQVILRVSDGTSDTDQEFQLEVFDVDDPPVFTTTPVESVSSGTEYSYIFKATDLEGDPVQYSPVNIPSWLQFNGSLRLLSGTPGYEDVGLYQVVIEATDGNLSSRQTWELEVIDTNHPPQFMTSAITVVNEDANYYYSIYATDEDGDDLVYSAPQIPDWLSFDPVNHVLSGKPLNQHVGIYSIVLRVTDGYEETEQAYQLEVINVNDAPQFLTEPVTTANALSSYVYTIEAVDEDGDDITFSSLLMPSWMTLNGGEQDAILFGSPTMEDIGSHAVIIQVSDGTSSTLQGFTVKVSGPTSIDEGTPGPIITVYPNPAHNNLCFSLDDPGDLILRIYSASGRLVKTVTSAYEERLEVDISDIERGIYIYKARMNQKLETGKFIKK